MQFVICPVAWRVVAFGLRAPAALRQPGRCSLTGPCARARTITLFVSTLGLTRQAVSQPGSAPLAQAAGSSKVKSGARGSGGGPPEAAGSVSGTAPRAVGPARGQVRPRLLDVAVCTSGCTKARGGLREGPRGSTVPLALPAGTAKAPGQGTHPIDATFSDHFSFVFHA